MNDEKRSLNIDVFIIAAAFVLQSAVFAADGERVFECFSASGEKAPQATPRSGRCRS